MEQNASDGSFNLNGDHYTSSQLTGVNSHIKYNSIAPYLGIGWGNRPNSQSKGFGVSFDLGVIYQGKAKVDLTPDFATGATQQSAINQDVNAEKSWLEDKLNKYQFYPVVNLGVYYRW